VHVIIWRYKVKAGRSTEFEKHYAPCGTWAEFFRRAQGYLRTELLHDLTELDIYWTLDYWKAEEDFALFKQANGAEYLKIDQNMQEFTEIEERIGSFRTL
jgi:heme-degrading monooxygenase HmoA